jgi:hypothetical protein
VAKGRGGYRKPEKPAPVSGPGRMSKRTDGGPSQKVRALPGGQYGEGAQFEGLEAAAAMAGREAPGAPTPQAPTEGPPRQPVETIPLGAPTQKPDEPVTAGSEMGPGVGPAAMGLRDPQMQIDQEDAQRMVGYLPVLEYLSTLPGSSQAMRSYVRQIKALAQ